MVTTRKPETLDDVLRRVLDIVEALRIPYLLIGGLAVGVVGEARMTQDVDLIVVLPIRRLSVFAKRAQAWGFLIAEASLKEARMTGAVRLRWGDFHVDVIFASTAFERSAFARKLSVTLAGRTVYVPSPEDLILLKLVPGREKDLFDVKGIIVRHQARLDRNYLEQWAQRLSDASEDSRIWETLQRLLNETSAAA